MKWLYRKKARLQEIAAKGTASDRIEEKLLQRSQKPLAADAIPADVREAIEKALAPYLLKDVRNARFFGVPMDYFTKDELIRIVSWVGMNSRDHRRDS